MSRNEKKRTSGHPQGSTNGSWVVRGPVPMMSTLKSRKRSVRRQSKNSVYVGPSVEGVDKKYVKVISGAVDDNKPSFA
ncbi:hypothetical protein PVOR_27954 [Paenibacillus vortex V453]|uniref:Uncharacterized protein n=2 Tax=Paenibacillus TaxID=44249 RepID=A0A163FU13_9BACL|nr:MULTISPECIES: hypothetical protein [Paenibacillus]ANA79153.1 hypothetical protein A3958_03655 [Paenibacillus glucanolyticus]AVV56916.1 hypothetical protein C7121_12760 [Paenibacillus glucanolyticus]AWP26077.1 hypothetical protein B9D94_05395 [Paenibacillus sp. Cedars]EFU38883.1 hypothetical protein PVOR_27954 [Paenibacillus vortex V453]ETT39305.1 hypothetical protein C169_10728 [Paenibacillus sp. FSL R5-808]